MLGSITEPPQYFSQTIRGEELGALRKLGSLRRKMLEWELSFAFSSPVLITIPRFLAGWKVEKLGHTTAIFRQVNKNEPLKHHDALEFPDGRTVLLADKFAADSSA